MSNYNRAKTIDTYFEKINLGELEIFELRKTLEGKNIEKEEIDIIIPLIDRKIQREFKFKIENKKGKNLFLGGIILSILGLMLTIITFTGLIDLNGYGIVAFGPILGGLIIASIGKAKMNQVY